MKNIYDDESFFENYRQMTRSQQGLAGAGEWPTFQALLPELSEKHILDLGCGYGWHCQYAAELGVTEVIGVDLSEKMLAVAQQKNKFANVTYLQENIEEVTFESSRFDLVLSSLAFHYIHNFDRLIQRVADWLVPGGQLIFSVEHPLFTAEGSQDWVYDQAGKIDHFPVDNYFYEGPRKTRFLDSDVIKYHRTLTTYVDTLLANDFLLTQLAEPTPPKNLLSLPGMQEEFRRPMMLILAAEKKK